MTYLIALIAILIFIVLFLLLYSPKHKADEEVEQHTKLVDELTAGTQASDKSASRSEPEPEPDPVPPTIENEQPSPVREETVTGGVADDAELTIDVADEGTVAGSEENELDLTFVEEVEDDVEEAPELGFAPPEESPEEVTAEEHELDLTLEEQVEKVDLVLPADESELVFEAPAAVSDEEPEQLDPDAVEEAIPLIVEDESAPFAQEEIAPALSDISEETAVLEDEAPDDLTERLDSFFGSSDEVATPVADPVAEIEEEVASALSGEVEAETAPAEVAEPDEEAPAVLTRDRYEAVLREQKEWLRGQLDEAIEQMETARLALLEYALTNVCGKLADMENSLATQHEFIAEIEGIAGLIRNAVPGFEADVLQTYLADGDWRAAGSLLADTAAQLGEDSSLAARLRYLAGRLVEEQAEFFLALEYYQGACESDGNAPEHLLAAGRVARIVGQDDEAEKWLEKLVASGPDGDDDFVPVSARHELARVYIRTDRKDKAEPLLKEALIGMEKLGGRYPMLGIVAYDLAVLYESSGMYEQAEPLYKQALEIMETGLGSEHPYLGALLNKLAGLYEELEMESMAEPLYARALEIKKEVLGKHHPDTGTILNNLANLLKLQGRYEEAETMFLQSLMIAEKALGKDHPNLAVVLNNIAELYSEMGNEEKAEQFQERAFALFELPGGGADFVEMEKDHALGDDDDVNQKIAGN